MHVKDVAEVPAEQLGHWTSVISWTCAKGFQSRWWFQILFSPLPWGRFSLQVFLSTWELVEATFLDQLMKMDLNRFNQLKVFNPELKRPPEDSQGWKDTFMVFFSRVVLSQAFPWLAQQRVVRWSHTNLVSSYCAREAQLWGSQLKMSDVKMLGCLVEQWKKVTWWHLVV